MDMQRIMTNGRLSIKWAAFAEVEGLSDALGDCLDPNMPEYSVSVSGKDVAGKLQEKEQESNGLPGIGFRQHEVVEIDHQGEV